LLTDLSTCPASRCAPDAAASTAPHPAFRDDHDTPLLWAGMGKVLELIWGEREAEYFFGSDWTDQWGDLPDGQRNQ
jgi:hypothetical protein